MVFAVDKFSKIFDGVEISDDDENPTILSEFKFPLLVHIHKITISWPEFPALGRKGSMGRMKRVTSKGCENIENCLHVREVDINEFEARDVTIKRFTLCGLGICYEF